jgi:hypothetical protein
MEQTRSAWHVVFGDAWIAALEWGWQYVFPAPELSTDPRSGLTAGITFTSGASRGRFGKRCEKQGSSSRRPATPCATPSPPTCWWAHGAYRHDPVRITLYPP